ncbi:hypothetical protein MASR1M12_45100 [Erysipelotrichia bacterium]
MREANTIGADKYFHCKANCEAVRCLGGKYVAETISEAREQFDHLIKGDPTWACNEDRNANFIGQQGGEHLDVPCSTICQQFRPRGLDPKY